MFFEELDKQGKGLRSVLETLFPVLSLGNCVSPGFPVRSLRLGFDGQQKGKKLVLLQARHSRTVSHLISIQLLWEVAVYPVEETEVLSSTVFCPLKTTDL